jgi:hypothetical protein
VLGRFGGGPVTRALKTLSGETQRIAARVLLCGCTIERPCFEHAPRPAMSLGRCYHCATVHEHDLSLPCGWCGGWMCAAHCPRPAEHVATERPYAVQLTDEIARFSTLDEASRYSDTAHMRKQTPLCIYRADLIGPIRNQFTDAAVTG